MDPTALITFLFRAPPDIRSVELLGSWDNFCQPYTMHHDRRRGIGFWTGCFKFENIIFDGDKPQWTKPRSGGLKQGGTYWYYYRLDWDVEAFDDSQEHTSLCPLMPGQTMNIMNVPVEVVPPPSRCRSVGLDIIGTLADLPSIHTWNPHDKFKALNPPPISRVHSRCVSDLALRGKLESGQETSPPALLQSPSHSHTPLIGSRPPGCFSSCDGSSRVSTLGHDSVVDVVSESPADEHPDPLQSAPVVSRQATMSTHMDDSDFADVTCDNDRLRTAHPHEAGTARMGSCSIQNVQFYDSRPTTSHSHSAREQQHQEGQTPDQWRPRLHSSPNDSSRHEHLTFNNHSSPQKHNDDGAHDEKHSRLKIQELEYNPSDYGDDDIWSPTCSVATVSTSGDQNIVFRLSARDSPPLAAYNEDSPHPSSLEDVPEHLQSLNALADSSELLRHATASPPPPLHSYSLPLPAMVESVQSLVGKLSSSQSAQSPSSEKQQQQLDIATTRTLSRISFGLPMVVEEPAGRGQGGGGGSMMEDLFSELGYLRLSIG